ncbi:MAG: hypothetical protein J6Y45_07755 [Bacteroidales bacterium]|nr:hypothetical protein [Bacteroidales bacterium]
MNRPLIAAAYLLLLAATPLCAQQERDLMLHADFDSLTVRETFPESANGIEKAAITIGRQILGHNYYNPPNVLFLRQAVREIGPVRGILATSDRLLRASKIGTADYSLPRPPLGIEEGPEAYTPRALTATTLAPTNGSTGARALTATTLALTNGSSRQAPGAVTGEGAASGIPGADLGPYEREAPGIPSATKNIAADYDFALYLIDNDLKQDALKLVSSPCFTPSDTLSFLRGWANYNLKQLPQARQYFQSIPKESFFYDRSLFYSAAVSAHMGDFTTPVAGLKSYDGPYTELRDLQLSGLALLRDDPDAFKQASGSFAFNDFALQEAEHTLCGIYDSRYVKRAKSPAVAAIASAIIPGAGKIYAGKLGEGVSAFLLTGVLGAITAEHWVKDGPANWKTIVPGLLGAFLYIGNIYGSYMSVSIYNSNLKDAQDTAVLYNIHIPLRSVFK